MCPKAGQYFGNKKKNHFTLQIGDLHPLKEKRKEKKNADFIYALSLFPSLFIVAFSQERTDFIRFAFVRLARQLGGLNSTNKWRSWTPVQSETKTEVNEPFWPTLLLSEAT